MGALIELRDIVKEFQTGAGPFRALDGVSLTVEEGELMAIVGPSGSGKSTLMNVIGCLDGATSGNYVFDGEDISSLDEPQLARLRNMEIGFVFQQFNLLPRLSARVNVALPLIYAGLGREERLRKAGEMLGRVGLAGKEDSRPSQLSGGQQQRVAIARALANSPRLILADEPTGALDTRTGADVMQLFHDLNEKQGVTVIIVTHDPRVAIATRRVLRILDGRVAYDGPPTPEMKAAAQQEGARV